jgi:hypothetical protein
MGFAHVFVSHMSAIRAPVNYTLVHASSNLGNGHATIRAAGGSIGFVPDSLADGNEIGNARGIRDNRIAFFDGEIPERLVDHEDRSELAIFRFFLLLSNGQFVVFFRVRHLNAKSLFGSHRKMSEVKEAQRYEETRPAKKAADWTLLQESIRQCPFLSLGAEGVIPNARPLHLMVPLPDWIKIKRAQAQGKTDLKYDEIDQIGALLKSLPNRKEVIAEFKAIYEKCWNGQSPAYVTPDVSVLYALIDHWPQ